MTRSHSTLDNYIVIKTLGKGATSKVKLVQDKNTQEIFAVKIFKPPTELNFERYRDSIANEIRSLKLVSHPNVIKCFGFSENGIYIQKSSGSLKKCTYLVMEVCPNGSLYDIIFYTGILNERITRYLFHQLVEALECCHNSGVTHRDLKPQNILFDENYNLKLSDFGLSINLFGRDGSGYLGSPVGTENYMAPEIHMRNPYVGTNIDVFSLGVILFIIYSYNPPFRFGYLTDPCYNMLVNNESMFWGLHSRNKSEGFYTPEFKSLIKGMLALDPKKRYTISDIKADSWYNGPAATYEEVYRDLMSRCQAVNRMVEQVKEQQTISSTSTKSTSASSRIYRGDSSMSEFRSRSLSIVIDDLSVKPLPESYITVRKFSQFVTDLKPIDLINIIIQEIYKNDGEVQISLEFYEIKSKIFLEENEIEFKATVYQVEADIYLLDLICKSSEQRIFIEFVKKLFESIKEVQSPSEESNNFSSSFLSVSNNFSSSYLSVPTN
ncbi:unnamed protein product [Blepharisma stoltei]|uniref:non-specific serine/threonine protein kinase n=1 Tax=Blepharisma stoltei TaxID=1481888 RepID=A0AAU9JK00_9CILI|nr:unnamed protein product [Blepharisma stoltei]